MEAEWKQSCSGMTPKKEISQGTNVPERYMFQREAEIE